MALFMDGVPSTVADLAALDSQLLNVAHAEGIDVTQKLTLAQIDLGLELTTLLAGNSYYVQSVWVTPRPDLNSVVATPAVKLWHTYRTLEMVYSDAYNSQLNDRYGGRRDQFHRMAKQAYEKLRETGLGIVTAPVPMAATPGVVAVESGAGGNLPDGTYYMAVAWVNAVGEEGAASEPTGVTIGSGTFQVDAGSAPSTAAGWNVYVGTDPNNLSLQSAAVVEPGVPWVQPGVLRTTGRAPGTGQAWNYLRPIPRVIQRG
jgi:hypothetical protein